MKNTKEFYGDTIIYKNDYNEFDSEFKIHLKYYKTQELVKEKNNDSLFGIEIVKKETNGKKINVETKKLERIVDTEEKVDSILEILQRNKVTPITVYDVLEDMDIV